MVVRKYDASAASAFGTSFSEHPSGFASLQRLGYLLPGDYRWFAIVEEEPKEIEPYEMGFVTDSPEVETSVDEGHRDWASLPSPVIDSLVRVLKDTRRWRLEGRSLRMLNRHWSAAVSMHVEEIRPDTTRKINDADLASLLKFERVTSVDISPFLTHPPKCALPKDRKQKKLCLENWYDTKLERLVDVLCQLPKLTQIEVGLHAMIVFHHRCARAQEQLSRLERITSAHLYGKENLKLYGKTHLNTLFLWPLRHPKDYSNTLDLIVGSLKRLESLEVEGSILNDCRQFAFLDEVKNVTLQGVDIRTVSRLPIPWATTVSSAVVEPDNRFALDTYAHLNRLVGLVLLGAYQDNLSQLSRSRVARYLKVLFIDGWEEEDELVIPNNAFYTFEQVECLNMISCHFDGASLRGSLPNLKALRIEDCTVTDSDVSFVSQFGKLELLVWTGVCSPNQSRNLACQRFGCQETLVLPWEKMTMPKLRSLSVVPILSDSELIFISRQTNLEVLLIGSEYMFSRAGTVTDQGIHALENLYNLRILGIQSFEPRQQRIWSSLLSTNLVTRLEQLWLLCDAHYPQDEQLLKRMRRRSPHTMVKLGDMSNNSFVEFDRGCFI